MWMTLYLSNLLKEYDDPEWRSDGEDEGEIISQIANEIGCSEEFAKKALSLDDVLRWSAFDVVSRYDEDRVLDILSRLDYAPSSFGQVAEKLGISEDELDDLIENTWTADNNGVEAFVWKNHADSPWALDWDMEEYEKVFNPNQDTKQPPKPLPKPSGMKL